MKDGNWQMKNETSDGATKLLLTCLSDEEIRDHEKDARFQQKMRGKKKMDSPGIWLREKVL